jgi:hypothetical protein
MARVGHVFQFGQAPVDQVVADMGDAVDFATRAGPRRAGLRQFDGLTGHRCLGQSAGLRQRLDDMAVAVAASEIHRGVGRT